ncbi:MAG: hypothetical protein KDA33_15585, partial [Phycisphaerales bacterium]|nr:hypothetical protein [Phycisphaerales bacterium]
MIPLLGAVFLVAGFVAVIRALGLAETGRHVVAEARQSVSVVRNGALGDDQKEKALQQSAKKLFRSFFTLALGGAAALFAPLLVVWIADALGWISLNAVIDASLSPV